MDHIKISKLLDIEIYMLTALRDRLCDDGIEKIKILNGFFESFRAENFEEIGRHSQLIENYIDSDTRRIKINLEDLVTTYGMLSKSIIRLKDILIEVEPCTHG